MAEATVGLLRAVLTSNNAQFDSSFDKSAGKVDKFDSTTKAAQRSVLRLVSDFRGDKVVAEATKMAAAVEKVGGAAKLTDGELARVNRTLDAAAAKYRILGQDIPPEIAKLRTEIAGLDRASGTASTGGLGKLQGVVGSLGKLLPALTVGAAMTGLLTMGAAALTAADKFVTFSERAGVSIETAQRWDYVAGQTSTSLEAFAAATTKLGINVGNGTTKVREAIGELGLAYGDLRQMAPEEQFNAVVGALENVDSITERNRLGTALFGKQFTEIAVAIEEGYTDIAKAAAVAGDDQVRAAEAAGDALEKLKQKFSAGALQVFGRLAQEITDTPIALERLTQAQTDYYHTLLRAGGDAYGYLLQLERERVAGMHDIELKTETVGAATTDYVAKLAAVKAEVAGLNTAQKAQIDAALKLGGVTDEMSDAIGVSTDALNLYKEQKEADRKKTEEATEAAKKFAESVRAVPIAFRGWVTIPETVSDTKQAIDEVRQSSDAMAGVSFAPGQNFVPFKGAVGDSGAELSGVSSGLKQSALFKTQMKDALKGVPQTMAAAMAGGGGIKGGLGAVGSQMGGLLGEKLGGAVVKKLAGAAIGKALGGVVGSIAGPLGSIAGAYIGNKLGSMFSGPSKEVKEMRATVAGFQEDLAKTLTATQLQEAGGEKWKMSVIAVRDAYLATGRTAAEAEKITKQLWDTGHPEKAKAAMEEINRVLEEQKAQMQANLQAANDLFGQIVQLGQNGIPQAFGPAIDQLVELGLLTDEQIAKLREMQQQVGPSTKQMEQALAVFGGRVESLGPAFKQAKINETAMEYVNAIETMIQGGGDLGGILFDAREEIGALVADAIKSGKTLPANMQPWIDDLFKAGNLVDENGQKITDISGLKYGEKMKTEGEKSLEMWDKILGKITELVDSINNRITPAIDDATRDREFNVTTNFRQRDGDNGTQEDDPRGHTVGTLGRYGTWFKNFGARTRTSLHGVEAVVKPSQAVPFAIDTLQASMPGLASAAAGGMSPGATGPMMAQVQLMVDGRRFAEVLVPLLPGAIRRHGVIV